MPPLESSVGQNTSPVRNETFQSIQSSIQLSPSPKRKSPPKSQPKKKKSIKPKEPSSDEESENEAGKESDQESPVENKRKPKLTKASFQIDFNITQVYWSTHLRSVDSHFENSD